MQGREDGNNELREELEQSLLRLNAAKKGITLLQIFPHREPAHFVPFNPLPTLKTAQQIVVPSRYQRPRQQPTFNTTTPSKPSQEARQLHQRSFDNTTSPLKMGWTGNHSHVKRTSPYSLIKPPALTRQLEPQLWKQKFGGNEQAK
jgi:hypothetical protein